MSLLGRPSFAAEPIARDLQGFAAALLHHGFHPCQHLFRDSWIEQGDAGASLRSSQPLP